MSTEPDGDADPGVGELRAGGPGVGEPGAGELGVGGPAAGDSGAGDPLTAEPVADALGLDSAALGAAVFNRARASARSKGLRPGHPGAPSRALEERPLTRDGRDPVPVGETLARLAAERGWRTELSVGGLMARWTEVVGAEVAANCRPETFDDGVLVVRAQSSAWAGSLTLYVPTLMANLAKEVGEGVVTEVRVIGPSAPRWSKGRRRVPGRGPRDTYG